MEITQIRRKLHQFIDSLEDKKVEAIYTLFEDEMNTYVQRKKLILAEREKYFTGEGKLLSWEEVKEMALNKDKRHAISN